MNEAQNVKLTIREVFSKAGHPVPRGCTNYIKISNTKFKVCETRDVDNWGGYVFGPTVGCPDESWIPDGWYNNPKALARRLDMDAFLIIHELPECVRGVLVSQFVQEHFGNSQ